MVGDVETGCRDHEMVEFRILCGGSMAVSRIATLDFRRENLGFFRDVFEGIPWVRSLERELVNIQASLLLNSRSVHPYE